MDTTLSARTAELRAPMTESAVSAVSWPQSCRRGGAAATSMILLSLGFGIGFGVALALVQRQPVGHQLHGPDGNLADRGAVAGIGARRLHDGASAHEMGERPHPRGVLPRYRPWVSRLGRRHRAGGRGRGVGPRRRRACRKRGRRRRRARRHRRIVGNR
ncbi:MAG: hypothetical protein WDO24_20555 [Pseudomonadota bacterium]